MTVTSFSYRPVRRTGTGVSSTIQLCSTLLVLESVLQCSNFLHCYVYRHANLCSGLREILSPQFIKKNLKIFGKIPEAGINPGTSRTIQFRGDRATD